MQDLKNNNPLLRLKQDMTLSFVELLYSLPYYSISGYSSERDRKKFVLVEGSQFSLENKISSAYRAVISRKFLGNLCISESS